MTVLDLLLIILAVAVVALAVWLTLEGVRRYRGRRRYAQVVEMHRKALDAAFAARMTPAMKFAALWDSEKHIALTSTGVAAIRPAVPPTFPDLPAQEPAKRSSKYKGTKAARRRRRG